MRIRDLVRQLGQLDPDLDVVCWCEDEKLVDGRSGFLLLDIESTGTVAGEVVRGDNGAPFMKAGAEKQTFAVLNVTADF